MQNKILEKLQNGSYDYVGFSASQTKFVAAILKMSFIEGMNWHAVLYSQKKVVTKRSKKRK